MTATARPCCQFHAVRGSRDEILARPLPGQDMPVICVRGYRRPACLRARSPLRRGRRLVRKDPRPPASRGVSCIPLRSEEHTSELQSLMRISYAVFCLKKKKKKETIQHTAK